MNTRKKLTMRIAVLILPLSLRITGFGVRAWIERLQVMG